MGRIIFVVALSFCVLWVGACSSTPERGDSLAISDDSVEESVELADSDLIPVGHSPIKGDDSAWVTVVVFADFQCSFGARLAATIDEVSDAFDDDTMRLVFKHHPLDSHGGSMKAAVAAEAAREQGKFWKMHDALFDDFARLSAGDPEGAVFQIAEEVGVDMDKLKVDMEREDIAERVIADRELGEELGLDSVPAVFINGGFIPGAQPPETYYQTIIEVRRILEQGVAQGELERGDVYRGSVEMLYAETRPDEEELQQRASPVTKVAVDGDEAQTAEIDETVVQIALFMSLSDEPSLALQREVAEIVEDDDEVRVVYFHLLQTQDEATRLAHRAVAGTESSEKLQGLLRWLSDEGNDWQSDVDGLEAYLDEAEIELVSDEDFDDILETHAEMAQTYEIQGTPTSFINGIRVLGVPDPPQMQALIEEQIALALRIAEIQGLSGQPLYEAMVEGNQQRQGGY